MVVRSHCGIGAVRQYWLLVIILIGCLLAAPARAACSGTTLEDARLMALDAAAILEKEGPYGAFPRFADPSGPFIDRDLYVFVIDTLGRMWFNALFRIRPGQSIIGSRDRQGRFYVREMIRIAERHGEGWVEYDWINPCNGRMEPKSTYVVQVGPLIVGVGVYGVISL